METREIITKLFPFINILLLLLSSVDTAILNVPDTVSEANSGKIYTLHTVKQTWMDARRVCRQGNGYLMNVGTEDKYQKLVNELGQGAFKDIMDKPWIGLYWSSPFTRHWDSAGCPPPQANLSSNYHWQNTDDYTFQHNYCYRQDDGLHARDCADRNTFICESPSLLACSYVSTLITSFKLKTVFPLFPNIDNCKDYCDTESGCFLVSVTNLQCVAMMAGDVSNTSVALKQCPSEERVENVEVLVITSADHGDPTECYTGTSFSVAVASTYSTPLLSSSTITATAVETVTVSETIFTTSMASTSLVSQTTVTVTDFYTETVYVSEMAHVDTITVTESVCETPSAYVTVSLESCSQSQPPCYETSSVLTSLNVTTSSSRTFVDKADVVSESPSSLSASFPDFPGVLGSDGVLRSKVCRDVIVVTPDPSLTSEVVASIVNELTVDRKNISAVIQKKISTADERKSSTAIGYAGIVFLVVPLILILVLDVPHCIDGGKKLVDLLQSQRDASRIA